MAAKESEQTETAAAPVAAESESTLREKIRYQVEYYLSRQNLLQDSFLVSKMDKEHYVDLAVIAEFNMIKQLTTDLDLILASIKDSDKIVIDDVKRRIKPVMINQRTTLIMRNIPTDADRSLVETLLTNAKAPKILNLRADVGNNWFATFETEEATKSALEIVKALKWNDKTIGVGIKSETGLTIGMTSGQGAPTNPLPYYMPMNPAMAGAAQNGGFTAGDGGGHYRHGGRGMGGRRMQGAAPGATAGADGDGKRQGGGGGGQRKGKGKGPRDGKDAAGDGGAGGRPAAAVPPAKEAPQAALNMADFPVLEANFSAAPKKSPDSAPASPTKGDGAATAPAALAAEASGSAEAPAPPAPVPTSGGQPKKLSYAQMAQAAAAAAAAAAPAAPSTAAPASTAPATGAAPAAAVPATVVAAPAAAKASE